jgi:hypothetical protein
LKDAIDYSRIATLVMEVCGSRDFHLIETLAELLAGRILADFPTPQVRVLVRKISPVVEPRVDHVSSRLCVLANSFMNWQLEEIYVEDFKFVALFLPLDFNGPAVTASVVS